MDVSQKRALNFNETIFLLQEDKMKFILKRITLHKKEMNQTKTKQMMGTVQMMLNKLYGSTYPRIIKPIKVKMEENYLYLESQLEVVSLQKIIIHHRRMDTGINKKIIHALAWKTYDQISRIRSSKEDFYNDNLKPSNIFYSLRSEEVEWHYSEWGLFSQNQNKYFRQMMTNSMENKSNASFLKERYQGNLFCLGAILLEMISLLPIDEIMKKTDRQILRFVDDLLGKNSQQKYDKLIYHFILELFQPTDKIKNTFYDLKQCTPKDEPLPNYENLAWTEEDINRLAVKEPYSTVIEKFNKIAEKVSCAQMLEKAKNFDPEYNFYFATVDEMEKFLNFNQIKLQEKQLYQFCFYLTANSNLCYIEIIKAVYPTRDILETVIKIAIQNYQSRRVFFYAQTKNRDYWKSEQIHQFMVTLGITLSQQRIGEIVQSWSGNSKRYSVKFEQFNKVFKGCGKDEANTKRQKTSRSEANQNSLSKMFDELKQNIPQQNLVSFFRMKDQKGKWVVDSSIQRQIKKYIRVSESRFKELMEEMWQVAGVSDAYIKVLRYIELLKKKKVYQNEQIFRMILIEKINELDRASFYRRYEKNNKGWSYQSLQEFNHDQNLQFSDIELKTLFRELDTDKSQYLNQKELIFSLTGLKQFDFQMIVKHIQELRGRTDMFQLFMRHDKNMDLLLDSPAQIAQTLIQIGAKIPNHHYETLFHKFKKTEKFQYLGFLRCFMDLPSIFLKVCRFLIKQFFQNDFDKFYELGVKQGSRKWNRESIAMLNDQYVIGLTASEISEIWKYLDSHNDVTLTRNQIAKIMNFSASKIETQEEELLGLESIEKFKEDKKKQNIKAGGGQKIYSEKTIEPKEKTSKDLLSDEFDKNQIVKKLRERDYLQLAKVFSKKSQTQSLLTIDQFTQCLQALNIRCSRNSIEKNTEIFQVKSSRNVEIDFIKLLMLLCRFIENEEKIKEVKPKIFLQIITQLIRGNELTTSSIFKKCRKGNLMRLKDFQNFIKDLCQVQIFFEDIEVCWESWGYPDHLTQQNFQELLNFKELPKELKVKKEFSFRRDDSSENIKLSKEKHQESRRSRKSSRQSRQQLKDSQGSKNHDTKKIEQKIWQRKDSPKQQFPPKFPPRTTIQQRPKEKPRRSYFEEEKQKSKEEEIKKTSNALTKEQVTYKFETKIEEKGAQGLNSLFMKTSIITSNKFIDFLQNNYEFTKEEAIKLAENMNTFGKIKAQTVKKYFNNTNRQKKKDTTPKKVQMARKQQKKILNSSNEPSPQRNKQKPSPAITNPKKIRLNIPLIKEHIRILVNSFSKRFDPNELQAFFFEGNDRIPREQFIKKCQDINGSISTSMYDKIFDYLKPKGDQISSISFKICFNFDENIEREESYLPDEIEKQIKASFQKADADKSGFIELNELQTLLNSLGLNESQRDIENYFAKIDQNFDKKISFSQFKIFIEDNILPYINDFNEDADNLRYYLQTNDLFQTGSLSVTTLGGVLEKYWVKLNEQELITLNRSLANENSEVDINDLMNYLYDPSQSEFSSSLKAVLYKIRWKKKVSFRDVQKVFEQISSSFMISYTCERMKKQILTPASFITPILHESRFFYADFFYANYEKIEQSAPVLFDQMKQNDLIAEIKLIEGIGLPIPQNSAMKNTILRRSLNVTFFDTSLEATRFAITSLEASWDPSVEDRWAFDKNNQSVFVKISQFDFRKFDKLLLLFEFVITLADEKKCLEISCGSATLPIKDLISPDNNSRKLKVTAGIPNKSKEIDRMSVSKRTGWRGVLGKSDVQSELQIQLLSSVKFKQKLPLLAALPQKIIINRKALHLFWTFRQYFASRSIDGRTINPDFCNHFLVKVFLLCLDIPDVYVPLYSFWKERVQPKVKIAEAKKVLQTLLQQLWLIIYSREFEFLPSYPCRSSLSNKSLNLLRAKMLSEVFANIESWISSGVKKEYKRKKQYGYQFGTLKIERNTQPNSQITDQLIKTVMRA